MKANKNSVIEQNKGLLAMFSNKMLILTFLSVLVVAAESSTGGGKLLLFCIFYNDDEHKHTAHLL